jgi:hypothetical protein
VRRRKARMDEKWSKIKQRSRRSSRKIGGLRREKS